MTPTAVTPPPVPAPGPRRRRPGRSVVIPNVDWDTYEKLLAAFGDRRNPRLTYDRGELEIMVPSFEHDSDAAVLARLAETLTEELGLPVIAGGSVTVKWKKAHKGIEPDRCFWIANAARMAGVRQLDLKVHPPPDLGIEVDVTSSSLNRLRIYARLGVAEVWRLEGDDLRFHHLGAKARSVEMPTSRAFPGVTPADLMTFVVQARIARDHNAVVRACRAWVRQRIASPPPP